MSPETFSDSPEHSGSLASPEVQSDILRIEATESTIKEQLGLEAGSPDLIDATDEFLVAQAEQPEAPEGVETALIAGALEATAQRVASADNPIQALERDGYNLEVTAATELLLKSGATLPDGEDAATVVAKQIDAMQTREAGNWDMSDDGELAPTFGGSAHHREQAEAIQRQPGLVEDATEAHVMAKAVDALRDGEINKNKTQRQPQLDRLEALSAERGFVPGIEAAKKQVRSNIEQSLDTSTMIRSREVHDALKDHIATMEKGTLEQQIKNRMEADLLPWTMPDRQLPDSYLEGIQKIEDNLTIPEQARPTDQFYIAQPMKQFEGGRYHPDDELMLRAVNIDSHKNGLNYTRQELKDAGVFFLNRVGGGEQPIFGVPIPNEDGTTFDVQDRTFLTREEFDKVYAYQQKHGYGIGDRDPGDVQLDMIVFAARPEARETDAKKTSGFGSRESKYGLARSPFVDSGIKIRSGVEPMLSAKELGMRRMNTMSIHLANAHPDYPGLSEMFGENAAHDQKYLSAGEFVDHFYEPPTTQQQALLALQNGWMTKRERLWVGPIEPRY